MSMDVVLVAKAASRPALCCAAGRARSLRKRIRASRKLLAIECRVDDASTRALLTSLDDRLAHTVFNGERAFLQQLGGDCDLPAGAHLVVNDDDSCTMRGILEGSSGIVHRAEVKVSPRESTEAIGRGLAVLLWHRANPMVDDE